VIGLLILGVSSLAAAFNFLTTIINLRAPGMTLMRMPMFTWMAFVVQFLLVLAFPVHYDSAGIPAVRSLFRNEFLQHG